MAVPKRKQSNARTGSRRSHDGVRRPMHLISCPQCNDRIIPHTVCPTCGNYMGRLKVRVPEKRATTVAPEAAGESEE